MTVGYTFRVGQRECHLSWITVEPVLFLYMFGSFLQFPTFQSLVYKKTCLENFNESFCEALDNKTFQTTHKSEQDVVQSAASHWMMLSNIGMALPSIFVVFFFVGSWGDLMDRKVPILVPCIGAFVYNLWNLLNAVFMDWPLDYLMIGPVFNGLFGGYITVLMGVYSYITHISSAEARTSRVGILESMTFIAGTISVFVSGVILEATSFQAVFAICCSCVGVASLYGVLWLDSVKPEDSGDKKENCCQYWFLDSLKDMLQCVKRPREDKRKLFLTLEIIVLNIMQLCTTGEGDILYLFLRRAPRSFSRTQYGYFKGTENFTRSVALITILPLMKHVLKFKDTTVVLIGLLSKTAGLVILGFADDLTWVFLVVVFAMFQGFPAAGLRSSMATMVEKQENGRLFAIVAATESCSSLASTFIFNGWYPGTLDTFDGTLFQFAAGMCVLAFFITMYLHLSMTIGDEPPSNQHLADTKVTYLDLQEENGEGVVAISRPTGEKHLDQTAPSNNSY